MIYWHGYKNTTGANYESNITNDLENHALLQQIELCNDLQ